MIAQFERFTIEMTKEQALSVSHPGPCDNDVEFLLADKKIKKQLAKISDNDLQEELRSSGAWTKEQLQNRKDNEMRIVWIAAGNICD